MSKKVWITIGFAFVPLLLFGVTATAQQATPASNTPSTPNAQIQPVTAVITQQVPISLTLRMTGATGVQTVTLPVLLNLNIQVGLARPISSALGVSVVAVQPSGSGAPAVSLATVTPPTPPPPTLTAPPATATPPASTPAATATPSLTGTPTVTTTVTPTPTKVIVVAPQCPSPGTLITSPGVNEVVSGTVTLRGTAENSSFNYYKLEYAVGANASEAAEYRYFGGAATQVTAGVLGAFDSQALPNRAYTLRLTVVDQTGNFPPPCQVTVLVKN